MDRLEHVACFLWELQHLKPNGLGKDSLRVPYIPKHCAPLNDLSGVSKQAHRLQVPCQSSVGEEALGQVVRSGPFVRWELTQPHSAP